jgi:hypothetical protein
MKNSCAVLAGLTDLSGEATGVNSDTREWPTAVWPSVCGGYADSDTLTPVTLGFICD